jgi:hypothetical protein
LQAVFPPLSLYEVDKCVSADAPGTFAYHLSSLLIGVRDYVPYSGDFVVIDAFRQRTFKTFPLNGLSIAHAVGVEIANAVWIRLFFMVPIGSGID